MQKDQREQHNISLNKLMVQIRKDPDAVVNSSYYSEFKDGDPEKTIIDTLISSLKESARNHIYLQGENLQGKLFVALGENNEFNNNINIDQIRADLANSSRSPSPSSETSRSLSLESSSPPLSSRSPSLESSSPPLSSRSPSLESSSPLLSRSPSLESSSPPLSSRSPSLESSSPLLSRSPLSSSPPLSSRSNALLSRSPS